ncbi:hypothetical protein CYMTET_15700 [Cymbomonas tetramitiformis]|uniref:Transmembrane protein n=1 Tax=Cymbomonas tetramitiformis TaxID=36881 RepID=A0AAE0L916_9CHLO|nr:hypothetical protein CYMTET_15700 [Cymbomonas tetramitiformis]
MVLEVIGNMPTENRPESREADAMRPIASPPSSREALKQNTETSSPYSPQVNPFSPRPDRRHHRLSKRELGLTDKENFGPNVQTSKVDSLKETKGAKSVSFEFPASPAPASPKVKQVDSSCQVVLPRADSTASSTEVGPATDRAAKPNLVVRVALLLALALGVATWILCPAFAGQFPGAPAVDTQHADPKAGTLEFTTSLSPISMSPEASLHAGSTASNTPSMALEELEVDDIDNVEKVVDEDALLTALADEPTVVQDSIDLEDFANSPVSTDVNGVEFGGEADVGSGDASDAVDSCSGEPSAPAGGEDAVDVADQADNLRDVVEDAAVEEAVTVETYEAEGGMVEDAAVEEAVTVETYEAEIKSASPEVVLPEPVSDSAVQAEAGTANWGLLAVGAGVLVAAGVVVRVQTSKRSTVVSSSAVLEATVPSPTTPQTPEPTVFHQQEESPAQVSYSPAALGTYETTTYIKTKDNMEVKTPVRRSRRLSSQGAWSSP